MGGRMTSYEDAQDFLTEAEKVELERLLEPPEKVWTPFPVQKLAIASPADVLLFGGAAGGGKSDCLLGLAHTQHTRSVIFRREFKQIRSLEDRSREMFGHMGDYNGGKGIWKIKSGGKFRQIEFGSCANPGDEKSWQGFPHDLKAFDEVEHFLESQFRFLCGWKRSADPKQRKRVVCASNPPTSAEGEWIISYWAPWLDPHYPGVRALPGELRWYTTLDGEDTELENGEPLTHKGERITPESRTFIPAKVQDNPVYMATGYIATLQGMPEPLRSKMLYGDFLAGREDNPYQLIPTAWVKAAQQRWVDGRNPHMQPMTCLGVDVARGGGDSSVISPRYANWFGEQVVIPGKSTPDGPALATQVLIQRKDQCSVQVDVVGVGSSVFDVLKSHIGQSVVAMSGAEKSEATDKSGKYGFINKRAEWWWKLREDLDPESGQDLMLPPGQPLMADLCAPQWEMTTRGIKVESKEDIKKRIQRSPDRGDSLVYANAIGRPASAARRLRLVHMAR